MNELIDDDLTEEDDITGSREGREEEYVPLALISEKRKNQFGIVLAVLMALNYLFYHNMQRFFRRYLDGIHVPMSIEWFLGIIPVSCVVIALIINVVPYSGYPYKKQFANTFFVTWIVVLLLHLLFLLMIEMG